MTRRRSNICALGAVLAAIVLPSVAQGLERTPVTPDPERPITSLSPPRVEQVVEPGTRYVVPIVVSNFDDVGYEAYVSLTDLEAAEGSDSLAQPTSGAPRNAGTWLTPELRKLQVGGGERVTFNVQLDVPEDAAPGVHPAAVIVRRRISQSAASTDGKARVTADFGLASQLLLTVPGNARTAYDLAAIAPPRFIRSGTRPRFTVELENTGQTLLKLDGKLALGSFLGTDAGEERLAASLVLPDGARRVATRWSDPPFVGWFKPRMFVTVNGTAETVRFPSVFVIPPWWVFVLLACAIALPIIARRRARRQHRR